MILERDGKHPEIASTALVAPTAHVIGDVRIGPDCVIDHGAVLASAGPPIVLERGVAVMPNAVVRSTGGGARPDWPVEIGADSLIGPLAALAGCTIGAACYVATAVMVFHGARVGRASRLGAGSVVHAGAVLDERSRVGIRQLAVLDGDRTIITTDVDEAREALARTAFFSRAFGVEEHDLESLHRHAVEAVRAEIRAGAGG